MTLGARCKYTPCVLTSFQLLAAMKDIYIVNAGKERCEAKRREVVLISISRYTLFYWEGVFVFRVVLHVPFLMGCKDGVFFSSFVLFFLHRNIFLAGREINLLVPSASSHQADDWPHSEHRGLHCITGQ